MVKTLKTAKEFKSAKLAGQILRAMEAGSATRLREGLDRAASMAPGIDRISAREEEQCEILAAIADQMRRRGCPSEVQVHLLRHFAGTVQVCLT